ncbi:MAG: Hpt domain-containing protein, partial [Anaerolineae bacterium]|nr:Hpt domain-containing protein [Anaerolineae bacterium]
MKSEAIIDMNPFNELRAATGDEFLAELIDTYCQETPQLLAELSAALARGDAETFRRQAHSIKSSSATFGATAFAAQARELEYLGRDGALDQVGDRAERLAADYAEVERALKEL